MASDRPLIRICHRVFADDYRIAQQVAAARNVPVNVIIRECLHTFVKHLNDLERRTIDSIKTPKAAQAPKVEAAE